MYHEAFFRNVYCHNLILFNKEDEIYFVATMLYYIVINKNDCGELVYMTIPKKNN